jgi:hypothetical protein
MKMWEGGIGEYLCFSGEAKKKKKNPWARLQLSRVAGNKCHPLEAWSLTCYLD